MTEHIDRGHWRRLVLVAGALAVLAAPAPAAAAYKVKHARFNVTLTAKQTTSWSVNHRDPFETCGLTFTGSGRQTLRLATKRPAVVHAIHAFDTTKNRETQALQLLGPRWRGTLATRATVDRSGTITTTPNSPEPCADGDGGPPAAPPAADCGRRKLAAYVSLAHFPAGSYPGEDPVPLTGVLAIQGPQGDVPGGAYENCPVSGDDGLLLSPNATLKVDTVMGKRKRFRVRGRAREVYDNAGNHHETSMSFTATFTRLRGRTLPPRQPTDGPCMDQQDNDGDGAIDDRDPDCYRTRGRRER